MTPGEFLLEEFLKPMGISQYRLAITCDWPDPPTPEESEVRIEVELQDHPSLVLSSRTIPIRSAIVTGVIRVSQTSVPLTAACYLAAESGEPFAAAALVATRAGLFGFAVAPNTNELRAFHIPEALRDKRPHRQKVFEAPESFGSQWYDS